MNRERWIAVVIAVVAIGSAVVLLGTGPEDRTRAPVVAEVEPEPEPEVKRVTPERSRERKRLRRGEYVPLSERKGPREAPSELARRDQHRLKKAEAVAASKPKMTKDRLANWRSPETLAGRGTAGIWTRIAAETKDVDPDLADKARRMSVDLRKTRKAEDPVDWTQLVSSQRDLLVAVTSSSAWGSADDDVLQQKVERITATLDYMESNPDWEQSQQQARAERRQNKDGAQKLGPG